MAGALGIGFIVFLLEDRSQTKTRENSLKSIACQNFRKYLIW
ncbi:hypothetical protein LEP1GSC017_1187 [Leptospira meyeri serovar Hardjo str. Went 5]|nr:hypothetical protein LEP1GSC017_1187 [Leptospira meyeri serovar Hardjo str. Went 5]